MLTDDAPIPPWDREPPRPTSYDEDLETAEQAIRDFLRAVDRGYLGAMPDGFNASAFVRALRKFQ